MFVNNIIAGGALLSLAAAVPLQHLQKRDIVWDTKIEWDVTTIPVTTTIWVNPGETPKAHWGHHGHGTRTSHILSTVTVSPSPVAASSPPETSAYVAPTQSEAAPAPVAPTTSTYVAPTTEAAPPPAPTTTKSSGGGGGSGGSGGSGGGSGGGSAPSGQTYTGDITYYTPGLGSCGITSTDSDSIVALPHAMMEAQGVANPNLNPLCGKTITISHGGVQATATVVDTCPGCEGDSIDLSPTLFQKFTPLGTGRLSGVDWWFS